MTYSACFRLDDNYSRQQYNNGLRDLYLRFSKKATRMGGLFLLICAISANNTGCVRIGQISSGNQNSTLTSTTTTIPSYSEQSGREIKGGAEGPSGGGQDSGSQSGGQAGR